MLLFHVYLSIKVALDLFRSYGGALIAYSSIFYKGMRMHVIILYNKYNRHWYVVIHVCIDEHVNMRITRTVNLKDLYKYNVN